ncbi:MAG TPA: branched-chain amino acid ABC transporter permease [Burkholderiaceae bacterium]|nr:branched-chain amino acid ABC transporter permease [Burkholderiaceae bacterium]
MDLVQFLVTGLTMGAVFSLVAIGFGVVFSATGVINFAQGEFVMVGGMAAAVLWSSGLPVAGAVVLACLTAAIVGAISVMLVVAPTRHAGHVGTTVATVGLAIFLQGAARFALGSSNRQMPALSDSDPVVLFGAIVRPQSLWIAASAVLSFLLIAAFLVRTGAGRAMLAYADNALAATIVGVRATAVQLHSYVIGAALAGLAGALVAPIVFASPTMGTMLGLKGFVAATIGGLGSVRGAIAGGLLLGVVEALSAAYVSTAYRDAITFAILIVVMLKWPRGVFGGTGVQRV